MSIERVSTNRCYWLIVSCMDGPLQIYTTDDTRVSLAGGVLPVFSFEEEAWLFLELRALGGEGCQPREIGPGELASLLYGLCRGVKLVNLDPIPEIGLRADYSFNLINRKNFVDHLLRQAVLPLRSETSCG